jgi:hypothetical protein
MTSHSSGCRARLHLCRRCTCGDRPEITHEAVDRFYSTIIKDSNMSSEDNAVIFGSRDNAGAGYPYKHAMIDIETMSTHPSNALVLSCALVPFAPERSDRLLLGRTYHWRFDLVPQLVAGRKVDESTQNFWSDQPLGAQLRLLEGKLVTLSEFHDELKDALSGIDHLWARGIVFDIGNLVTLFRNNGLVEPWSYSAPDDVRTICRHTPQTRDKDISEHGFVAEIIPHDPVSDCIKQAHEVWAHWQEAIKPPVAHHPV